MQLKLASYLRSIAITVGRKNVKEKYLRLRVYNETKITKRCTRFHNETASFRRSNFKHAFAYIFPPYRHTWLITVKLGSQYLQNYSINYSRILNRGNLNLKFFFYTCNCQSSLVIPRKGSRTIERKYSSSTLQTNWTN